MTKVISFSLYGDKNEYCIGALKNAKIAKKIFPEFECWFYVHKPSAPKGIYKKLAAMNNVKIIFREGNLKECKPMMWRFEPIYDESVELMLSRDTDSRLTDRDVICIKEFIESDKEFNIIRDHPYHVKEIMGGTFAAKQSMLFSNFDKLIDEYKQVGMHEYDQRFLKEKVYPLVKDKSLIHSNWKKFEGEVVQKIKLPYNKESYYFIGASYNPNDVIRSIEKKILIKYLKERKKKKNK